MDNQSDKNNSIDESMVTFPPSPGRKITVEPAVNISFKSLRKNQEVGKFAKDFGADGKFDLLLTKVVRNFEKHCEVSNIYSAY